MSLSLVKRLFVLFSLATVLFSGSVYAQNTKAKPVSKGKMELTAEQRKKMAEMHEKIATCLRSDKSMDECHNEMRNSCKEMGDSCPMMGKKHGHHMMHGHDHDMDDSKKESEQK